MDAPDGFSEHVGDGKHVQLRECPGLGNRNRIGHHDLFKQSFFRQAFCGRRKTPDGWRRQSRGVPLLT